jgi:hypothetical protein
MVSRVALVLLVLLFGLARAAACGFIEAARNIVTLRQEAAGSQFVLLGKLENAQQSPDDGPDRTDFVIQKTLQSHPAIQGRRFLRIPRYIPLQDRQTPLFLVFGEVVDGEIEIHRGTWATKELVDYFEGILRIEVTDKVKRMRYAFDFLEHPDKALAEDAFGEFMTSTDPDIRTVARTLPPFQLRRWIDDEKTSTPRLRLYAYLLGNCGGGEDVLRLRKLLDRLGKQPPAQIDGILTAYTLLDPVEGWAYTRALAQDSTAAFAFRYSALRAARYFFTTHPGVVTEANLLQLVESMLEQNDLADLPLTYLRDWKCWKLTGRILALWDRPGYETPLIRRSILYYALRCPEPQAGDLVAKVRKTHPELVEQVEEILEVEVKP